MPQPRVGALLESARSSTPAGGSASDKSSRAAPPPMTRTGLDAVIWGLTASGRPFRPSDWADRLAGLTSAFGQERRLAYSPFVRPVTVAGVRAVIVGAELEALEPRLHHFLVQFARDNGLALEFRAGARAAPQSLVPPSPGSSTEPREPV